MAKSKRLVTIGDFEDEYGTDTMDRVLTEHMLVMREQARRFRKVEALVMSGEATIERVREIVESEMV